MLDWDVMKKQGTVQERRAWTAERRESLLERDAARVDLAGELAARARIEIPHERGLLIVPPGGVEHSGDVLAAGSELIESIGHDRLVAEFANRKPKGMARNFLPPDALQLDSPYMRFALGDDIVTAVTAYLGVVPVLAKIDCWYSVYEPVAPHSSQLWHLDGDDATQMKVWVHLADVGRESGPLTALAASASDALADSIHYDFGGGYRVSDDHFAGLDESDLTYFEGPAGTVDFVDTSRCFHCGSRVDPDGPPRRLFMLKYLTPWAFEFNDHREEAPFRDLASSSSSTLETLLLGAV